MTQFQGLVSRGAAFVEDADPEPVTIDGFPEPLLGNVGGLFRKRVMTDDGFRVQERGTVEIRRTTLARKAPGLPDPESHTDILVRGKVYRIDHTIGDTTTLRVEFAAFV